MPVKISVSQDVAKLVSEGARPVARGEPAVRVDMYFGRCQSESGAGGDALAGPALVPKPYDYPLPIDAEPSAAEDASPQTDGSVHCGPYRGIRHG